VVVEDGGSHGRILRVETEAMPSESSSIRLTE